MRNWAFALSIASGILILAGGVLIALMAASGMMGSSSIRMGMGGMMEFSGAWHSS
jgi:hypothetical protein